MSEKAPVFPGFTALSDQVFVREADPQDGPAPADHPTAVVILGWGDGLPKHVAKYAEGFRALFPRARIVAVLSPISKAMFSDLGARSAAMVPVVETLFPGGPDRDTTNPRQGDILLLAMSNTGAINYAATLHAYRERYGAAMPHRLLVLDSTPGGTDMTVDNLKRWGRAMALGTAAWFPWPFVVTQTLWAGALVVNSWVGWALGRHHPGAQARQMCNDAGFEDVAARRLYVYSREDDLIGYGDIENHIAETKEQGWEVDVELFKGSNHVGHMRMFPQEYWAAIRASWLRAVGTENQIGRTTSLARTLFRLPRGSSTMSKDAALTPLASLRVSRHQIPAGSKVPNTSIQHRPLLIYHGAFAAPAASASAIESHLSSVGVVAPQWRYTMYDTSHFHSTTHEVLCVSSGRARLCFGGEDNDGRVEPVVERGDVMVVPAGVAHRLLEDLDGGFQMVGSYPPGQSWDMCYGAPGEQGAAERIRSLGWFRRDPVYGDDGPVLHVAQ
ncbi:paxu protein [Paramyrothecium foliicola]|nr:paxu protein [Paramyrothecium foliicola]